SVREPRIRPSPFSLADGRSILRGLAWGCPSAAARERQANAASGKGEGALLARWPAAASPPSSVLGAQGAGKTGARSGARATLRLAQTQSTARSWAGTRGASVR